MVFISACNFILVYDFLTISLNCNTKSKKHFVLKILITVEFEFIRFDYFRMRNFFMVQKLFFFLLSPVAMNEWNSWACSQFSYPDECWIECESFNWKPIINDGRHWGCVKHSVFFSFTFSLFFVLYFKLKFDFATTKSLWISSLHQKLNSLSFAWLKIDCCHGNSRG